MMVAAGGEDLGFVGEVSLFLRGKKRKLTAESLDLTGSQKGDDTILPVKARTAVYLAQPPGGGMPCGTQGPPSWLMSGIGAWRRI